MIKKGSGLHWERKMGSEKNKYWCMLDVETIKKEWTHRMTCRSAGACIEKEGNMVIDCIIGGWHSFSLGQTA